MLAFFAPGLRQFQFEQTSPNTLLLRISVNDGYADTKQFAEKNYRTFLQKQALKALFQEK